MSNKNFYKKENKKVKEETLKSAEKPADDFDKIPEEKPKFNLPLMMAAAATIMTTNMKKEENIKNIKGVVANEKGLFISEDAIPGFTEVIKLFEKDLHDLIDKKFTPEMVKVLSEVIMSVSEKQTEIKLKKMEKELELKEREFELMVKKYEFEKRKKEEA